MSSQAQPQNFDVIVIGAGAAGLMAALTAGQRGKRVLLLEQNDEAGKKILISGGGRCNFTNREAVSSRYHSANPSFCISALRRYPPAQFVALIEKHGIAYHEKKLGQLFCDGASRAIVVMLLAECAAAGVTLCYNTKISQISKPDQFHVESSAGILQCNALIVASGGLSIPKLGATNFAYEAARRFAVPVTELRPALVPLTFQDAWFTKLAGVSLPALVKCAKETFAENILFTHRGLSGPAILQISSVWREERLIRLDLLPDWKNADSLLAEKAQRPNALIKTVLANFLPQRFAEAWCAAHGHDRPLGQMRDIAIQESVAQLKHWSVQPSGTEGYAKAEVTLGGIDTDALSSQSMMVKAVPGLYFVGEAVDVTGWLGGYNFQWAWASGWCAGMAVP